MRREVATAAKGKLRLLGNGRSDLIFLELADGLFTRHGAATV